MAEISIYVHYYPLSSSSLLFCLLQYSCIHEKGGGGTEQGGRLIFFKWTHMSMLFKIGRPIIQGFLGGGGLKKKDEMR